MSQERDSTLAPRVLVIDDEPQIRKFIDISLRSQGYATLLAETGQQGLAQLASKGADIVVGGSVGSFSAFMAQAGNLVILGDAGDALGAAGGGQDPLPAFPRPLPESTGAQARIRPSRPARIRARRGSRGQRSTR